MMSRWKGLRSRSMQKAEGIEAFHVFTHMGSPARTTLKQQQKGLKNREDTLH